MKTSQIGAAGVLLIQYKLIKNGIESAPMTTDDGVDLVAYSSASGQAVTIQVKANLRPKRAGGRGALCLDWWLSEKNQAELIGLADLSTDAAWLFTRDEFRQCAQQRSNGRIHFYFYTDPTYKARAGSSVSEFERFRLENRLPDLFILRDCRQP
jgi:hypothetical protein